jgi:hypothetical protein
MSLRARAAGGAVGVVGAVALGLLVALACAATSEEPAQGAPPAGSAPLPPYVIHGLRGEVEPPDIDDIEHMCALLTSCSGIAIPPSLFPADFGACVKKFSEDLTSPAALLFSLTIRDCGLQSNSCNALKACALHGADPNACSGRGSKGVVNFCDDGDRAIACFQGQTLAVGDCGRGGEQCIVSGGQAGCVLAPNCSSMTNADKPQCSASGTHKLSCDKGKLKSFDCGLFGTKCVLDASGAPVCAPPTNACTSGAKRCDGTSAVGCFNGHEVRVDCSKANLGCDQSSPSVGLCNCPSGSGSASDAAKCDGGNIKYNFCGKPRAYNCKALGFKGCDDKGKGVRCQ